MRDFIKNRYIYIGGDKMGRFKFFLERYKKEVLVGFVGVLFILIIGGIYFFHSHEESKAQESSAFLEKTELEEVPKKEETEKIKESPEEGYRIDIKGEVKRPGVYIAKKDMRVVDVLTLAGGLTKNADTSVNNLSRKVFDEMVIKIYSKKEVEAFSETKEKEQQVLEESKIISDGIPNDSVLSIEELVPSASLEKEKDEATPKKKVSINTATVDELITLNGIGAGKASLIVAYRDEHGPFEKIEDLMNVSGIGQAVFDKIKDDIEV